MKRTLSQSPGVFGTTGDIPIPASADSVSLGYVSGILYVVDSLGTVIAVGPAAIPPGTSSRSLVQVSCTAGYATPAISVVDGDALPAGCSLNISPSSRSVKIELNAGGIVPSPIAIKAVAPFKNEKCFASLSSFSGNTLDEASGFFFNTLVTVNVAGNPASIVDYNTGGFNLLFVIEWYEPI